MCAHKFKSSLVSLVEDASLLERSFMNPKLVEKQLQWAKRLIKRKG